MDYYQNQVEVAQFQWKKERANYLPKVNLDYTIQSVDGISGFNGWEAGISVPLLFFSQKGRTKAAQIDIDIARQKFRQNELGMFADYQELIGVYTSLGEILEYYRTEALPLAEDQIEASDIGYRLGSIDYIQFIQNTESAIQIREDYLQNLSAFFRIKEQLKYIIER